MVNARRRKNRRLASCPAEPQRKKPPRFVGGGLQFRTRFAIYLMGLSVRAGRVLNRRDQPDFWLPKNKWLSFSREFEPKPRAQPAVLAV